jgi:hypothetical protein
VRDTSVYQIVSARTGQPIDMKYRSRKQLGSWFGAPLGPIRLLPDHARGNCGLGRRDRGVHQVSVAYERVAKAMFAIWRTDQTGDTWNQPQPNERAAWLRVATAFADAAWETRCKHAN